jgi:hypothetical protein
MSDAYVDYGFLLDRFLSGAMPVDEFQTIYLERFKNEARRLDEPLFKWLDGLFGDVDAFTTDPQLRAENPGLYLNEAELRERVKLVASHLASS